MNNIALDYVHTLQKLILCIYVEVDKIGDSDFTVKIGSTMLFNMEETYKNIVGERKGLYKKVIELENKIKDIEKDRDIKKIGIEFPIIGTIL